MTREEARKLLSGYATGSLTELEQQLLFDAAMEDQELFDELAEEQAVKELVELPGAKRRLLLALGPARKRAAWWPWAAGVAVAATVAVAVWVGRPGTDVVETAQVQAVRVETPAASQPAAPPPPETAPAAEAIPPPADLESTKTEVAVGAPSKEADAFAAPQAKTLALADRANSVARDDVAPVPIQLEARAKQQLPILAIPQPARQAPGIAPQGFLAGPPQPAPPPPAAPQASLLRTETAAISSGGALTYEVRNTGILRITPSREGVLEVTFDGRPLYPSRPVAAGNTIDVSIPLEAKQLRIDFASDANAPVAAAQSGQISGTLALPTGPNSRAVVVIPAQR